jgi:hypothetical protein
MRMAVKLKLVQRVWLAKFALNVSVALGKVYLARPRDSVVCVSDRGRGGLNWEEEQERLTLEARLLASSPEVVFEELKKLSAKTRARRWWNDWADKYEISLINRNERLINLGLAAYGTNTEVLTAFNARR